VELIESDAPHYERQVQSVISAVEKGQIPRAQYGALLIDEGHDFEADWLRLITQMVDPEINSLLLLYDDAQSIYKKKSGLGFTLSSVGIRASGRTTILRLNYRNTREILKYAYDFASHYLERRDAEDEDHVPLIEPEAAGTAGPEPVLRKFDTLSAEADFMVAAIRKWNSEGVAYRDVAVLYPSAKVGEVMAAALQRDKVPHLWLKNKTDKLAYDPAVDQINLLTIHSSKGLEFPRVIMVGAGALGVKEDRIISDARLCYVGMTRAQECLLVTSSRSGGFSDVLGAIDQSSLDS
jgi:superfamily I DNA/RNA helicase